MDADFSWEETSLRSIETLFTRLEGRGDEQPLFYGMANMLMDKFFEVPRQKPNTIYELLTNLKVANWDTNLQNGQYLELSERLKRITNDLKQPPEQIKNSYEAVDRFIFLYRILLLTFVDIDALYVSVESLCVSRIIM